MYFAKHNVRFFSGREGEAGESLLLYSVITMICSPIPAQMLATARVTGLLTWAQLLRRHSKCYVMTSGPGLATVYKVSSPKPVKRGGEKTIG